jgi:hypothetical protein
MGYPTIDKFDIRFIERTKDNLSTFQRPNAFTHLINSLVGLIFIPIEFHKKGKKKYKVNFLNNPISHYKTLEEIFTGNQTLVSEQGRTFQLSWQTST